LAWRAEPHFNVVCPVENHMLGEGGFFFLAYLDSKSTLFEVINNFRLYDRVCIVSALTNEVASRKHLVFPSFAEAKRRLTIQKVF
jgi:hypothetical protein